jgi:hypothetical protein
MAPGYHVAQCIGSNLADQPETACFFKLLMVMMLFWEKFPGQCQGPLPHLLGAKGSVYLHCNVGTLS